MRVYTVSHSRNACSYPSLSDALEAIRRLQRFGYVRVTLTSHVTPWLG